MPFSQSMAGIEFTGQNVKRDGTLREWITVTATGNYFTGRDGACIVEVREGVEERHLNLNTFTGNAVNTDTGEVVEYENGKKLTVV